jgi:hypothetical protein
LNIVRVVNSPGSSHSFGILIVWHYVVIVAELFLAGLFGKKLPATAGERIVYWAVFIATESHDEPPFSLAQ